MTVQLQIQEILNRVFDAVNNRLRVAGKEWGGVVDPDGGSFSTLQAADNDLDSDPYTLWVKRATYGAGLTVTTDEVHIYFEPGTVIEAALVFSGADISVEFGSDCDVQGTITMGGANWKLIMGAGCTTTGLVLSGAGGLHDGGGFTTIHNGGTTNHGINVTSAGDDVVIQNCACQTTAGGGQSFVGLNAGGASSVYQNIRVIDSDADGVEISGVDSLFLGIEVQGADGIGMRGNGQRERIIGCRISETGSIGISLTGGGDNSLITGCLIRNTTGDTVDIHAACEDCLVVGNKLDGAVDDNSGTSTVASNEETAF